MKTLNQRPLSFTEACSRYVHRFTMEHTPSWARAMREDGTYYAPQFATDREWYDHTLFHGEEGFIGHKTDCFTTGCTWPLGQSLPEPYSTHKHRF